MNLLEQHPTVQAVRTRDVHVIAPQKVNAAWLRQLCLEAGADDVGFVSIDREEIAGEKPHAVAAFRSVRTFVSLVFRMNRESVRSPARSAANLEFHGAYDHATVAARNITAQLERAGIRAMNPSAGFPMEMDRFPGRIWVIAHKTVAVAAGMGRIGVHRNVIHPRFGNFIVLETLLLGVDVDEETLPIAYNPCLECKLCVAACPVGAIHPDGGFDFSACFNHNYREFMGGFTNWVEDVADSKSALDYRKKVSDSESASMWQSLSFKPGYKAAYCVSVCPAGEEVIEPFLDDRPGFLADVVKPLQEKEEPVYVVQNSDAEAYVAKRFPHKTLRRVRSGMRPTSIEGFLRSLPLVFQRGASQGIDATFHFVFTGKEKPRATVVIREQKLTVQEGLVGTSDVRLDADSETWLGIIRKERGLVWAILRGQLRVQGRRRLLADFRRCFPS